MSDIEQRFDETSKACIEKYKAWDSNRKDAGAREELQDAVHELRKVLARLEIAIVTSEREGSSVAPIPIPTHRTKREAPSRHDAGNNGDHGNGDAKPKRRGPPKRKKLEDKPEPQED